ncbi:MAG: hypothetical protein HY796_06300 [Elusimicrobia bacterium]|nr:hypothetical protein [Elusimicrobiota bacterium]
MDAKASGILERLAVSGLEKCLARLSKVSAGTWRITGARLSWGTPEDALRQHDFTNPTAAVYFNVKGGFPFTLMMLFDLNEIELVSKCFLGYAFPRAPGLTQPQEVLLLELGNIILNSLINSVLNALKRSCVPPAPRCVGGDLRRLLEELGGGMDLKQNFRIITVTLAIQCDTRASTSEVFGLIPEELADELERLYKEER